MKVIGILSDTHGLFDERLYGALYGSDLIIHAGDIGRVDILEDLKLISPVVAVLGNNDYDEYGPDLGYSAQAVVEGVRIFVSHYPESTRLPGLLRYIKPGNPLPQVCIHGHTHIPEIVTGSQAFPASYVICPGSTSRPRGGSERSVALMQVDNGRVLSIEIRSLSGEKLLSLDEPREK
ncbi:MAG: metallophosphoesterase family protein [Eggerthellaceae bacterium]|jgi:putative phosphoesterase